MIKISNRLTAEHLKAKQSAHIRKFSRRDPTAILPKLKMAVGSRRENFPRDFFDVLVQMF